MKILEKYTGEKTYMFPNGAMATPEAVLAQFPAALAFTHVAESDEGGEVLFALQNLSALRTIYEIGAEPSEQEAIAAIQEIINTPQSETLPETDAGLSAQLEYQQQLIDTILGVG